MRMLEYSTLPTGLERWTLRRLVRAMPCWVIAAILLIPAVAQRYAAIPASMRDEVSALPIAASFLFYVALFIPGSLKRRNWRHMLLAVAGAAMCFGIEILCVEQSFELRRPLAALQLATLPILAVAVVEWGMSTPRQLKSLAWVVGMSIAAGCLIVLVALPLDYKNDSVRVVYFTGAHEWTTWERLLQWPLQSVLTWAVVPFGLRVARSNTPIRFAAIVFSMASWAVFYLVFSIYIYSESHRSLRDGGSFIPQKAMTILSWRGNVSDKEAIWQRIVSSEELSRHFTGHYSALADDGIRILELLDRPFCAERLSTALFTDPSWQLAETGSDTLGLEHRYETIPILTRYALMDDMYQNRFEKGLRAMGAWPEAAAIVATIFRSNVRTIFAAEPPIRPDHRARLTELLGVDAGPHLSDWSAAFQAAGPRHLPQLTPAQAAETFRIERAMVKYWIASDRDHAATCQVFFMRLRKDGHATEANSLNNVPVAQLSQLHERYWEDARRAMNTSDPYIDGCGRDELERVVDAYCLRVEAAIAKHGLATTKPAATQLSN